MDAKLNPISNSAAGIPLTVESSTAQLNQTESNSKLAELSVEDTLETSDREGDGRLPLETPNQSECQMGGQQGSADPSKSDGTEKGGQGSLLDLQG